jgi:phosphoribosylformimino-5-aminoimidazole carboxamide ribotide isomerase
MIIFPAIDIQDGKVVRLLQGDFAKATEYSQDPVSMAHHWEAQGAQWLHLIDLDGARTGSPKNLPIIAEIARSIGIPVQMGGGVRTQDDIQKIMDAGVARVILGTKAVEDLDFLKNMLSRWNDKIAVSLDCKNGYVTSCGWTSTLDTKATDIVQKLEALGLRFLIYTDIETDGMLTGPNFAAYEELLEITHIPVIASGGISSLQDIKTLRKLETQGIIGAISGKAIYEGKLDLKQAIEAANA